MALTIIAPASARHNVAAWIVTLVCAFFLNCQEVVEDVDTDIVSEYLEYPLWTDRDAYDAAHYLMVPMHYAYKENDENLKRDFQDFFTRFRDDHKEFLNIDSELKRLQFNYLISRYAVLESQQASRPSNLLKFLISHLEKEVWSCYHVVEVINWKYPDNDNTNFSGNRNRIIWKLTSRLDHSYFKKAIIDPELFLMGIAADLSLIYKRHESLKPSPALSKTLNEINTLAFIVFKERFTKSEDGWIFQKGYWYRHRDFKYAGCLTETCIEKGESPIKDIAPDTSHSLRLPLILSSLRSANGDDEVMSDFYNEAKKGLADQLTNKVIEVSNGGKQIRITNYLDGRNGYYRWNYVTNKGSGYGPYEVGETFKLGWWSFLDDPKIKKVYARIAKNLEEKVPAEFQYQDKTNRERNPVIAGRFQNGLYRNITMMAANL